jgi:1-acyl-sn-glycerol-3-phosphate acyltransferase
MKTVTRGLRFLRVLAHARWSGRTVRTPLDQAAWLHDHAGQLHHALEIHCHTSGIMPERGLIVGNHVSYLDVVAIGAQGPCRFVAKADVRSWPVIGGLLATGGTILVEREKRLAISNTVVHMRQSMAETPVVFFPEGTTTAGTAVGRFRPALFQAAVDAAVPITPVGLAYAVTGGPPGMRSRTADQVAYWGADTFLPHLLRLLGLPEIHVGLVWGEPWLPGSDPMDRKTLAALFQDQVVALHQQAQRVVYEGAGHVSSASHSAPAFSLQTR